MQYYLLVGEKIKSHKFGEKFIRLNLQQRSTSAVVYRHIDFKESFFNLFQRLKEFVEIGNFLRFHRCQRSEKIPNDFPLLSISGSLDVRLKHFTTNNAFDIFCWLSYDMMIVQILTPWKLLIANYASMKSKPFFMDCFEWTLEEIQWNIWETLFAFIAPKVIIIEINGWHVFYDCLFTRIFFRHESHMKSCWSMCIIYSHHDNHYIFELWVVYKVRRKKRFFNTSNRKLFDFTRKKWEKRKPHDMVCWRCLINWISHFLIALIASAWVKYFDRNSWIFYFLLSLRDLVDAMLRWTPTVQLLNPVTRIISLLLNCFLSFAIRIFSFLTSMSILISFLHKNFSIINLHAAAKLQRKEKCFT